MMRRPRRQRDDIASLLFGLTDKSVAFRKRWRMLAGAAAWFILSGVTMTLTFFDVQEPRQRVVIVVMSFLKYIPLLFVAYTLARHMAAHYLDDIFELQDESLATDFLEEVAFGEGHEFITIKEGRIPESDERSPLILIGGPGQIQVNLDSVALLEKLDGEPEVIYPRGMPWKLGRFERIREIGRHDEVGKREYAIINLRDQFISGLTVKARTKDGIPIEAQDIKVIFSILRRNNADDEESDAFLFDERAVQALVYNQTTISPQPSTPSGANFPWDTTVVPLVKSELEKLITSHTLSEILASISQKEMDQVASNENTIAQMRVELTGQHALPNAPKESHAPNFETRSKITSQFFLPGFRQKAARLGVSIEWIDVGTWQPTSGVIMEKYKQAWNLMRENAKRRESVEHSGKKHETKEFMQLVKNVVIANYEKTAESRKISEKEMQELEGLIAANPNVVANPQQFLRQFTQPSSGKRDPRAIALEILKAIRKELLAAKVLIEKETRSPIEKQVELAKINKALSDISRHTAHYL
ncbi:MAG: hypothetical protein QY332_14410 [Anaerolineales bacterium]|nr:MAG: hypothetical protein QY332_14410 [Anaerolineales bacterium]